MTELVPNHCYLNDYDLHFILSLTKMSYSYKEIMENYSVSNIWVLCPPQDFSFDGT